MIRDVDQETADVLLSVVAAQKEHLAELETLREALNAARGDVGSGRGASRG